MRSTVLRRAGRLGGILLAPIVAAFLFAVGYALLSPYVSARIPAPCTAAVSHLPASRAVQVPGAGVGTLLAGDANTSIVVVGSGGHLPSGGTVYIVDRRAERVVQHLRLASDAVVATVSDGIVFLFDDKLGYVFRASTGERVRSLIESDNYRGLYTSGGTRYLQTNAEITALGFDGSLFFHRTVRFAGIAYGCFIAPPAG